MKYMTFTSVAVAAVFSARAAEARLYHLALGTKASNNGNSRDLASVASSPSSETDLDNLYQARGVQYADLKVGCPSQSQSAIISTESKAIGFPCSGCKNDCGEGSHLNGLYNEKMSTCYSQVKCGECKLSSRCSQRQCPVGLSYAEGSSWQGYEVEDNISVGGEDSDDQAFPLRFGCQTDITGLFEGQIPDGIFGMNKAKGSAISQWSEMGYLDASAFSLCYNVREDTNKKSGVMVLGGADNRLHEKPMVFAKDVGEENYEVLIKDIRLERGPGLSVSAGSTTNVSLGLNGTDKAVLGSGTTCSYLKAEWKDSLQDAWRQTTGGKYPPMFSRQRIADQDIDELPTIVFELEGANENETITVSYPPIRYMEKSDSGGWDFCLYANDYGLTTLGNTFMSGHDVLHDIDNGRIGFAESKCEIEAIQISVESDADKTVGANQTHSHSMTLTKPKIVGLQSEPIHKRQQLDPTTPLLDALYVALALGVLVLGFIAFRRRQTIRFWNNPTTKHAFQLSIISLVLTVLAIAAGVALSMLTGSSLFLAFALENCVDFLSSVVVLWRFFAPSSNISGELEAKLKGREQRASVAISFVLLALGLGVWITAFEDLMRGQEDPSQQKIALVIAFFSAFLFGILTLFKFHYGKVLDSPSLYKDGICSMIGTTLSASLFINTLIIREAPAAWWIDPAVAIACGFAALVYGMWTLHTARRKDNLPIFSLRWWFFSHGADTDTDAKNATEEDSEDVSRADEYIQPTIAELT